MKHDSASIRKVIAKGIVKDMDEKSLSDYLKLFISNEDKKEYITQLIALRNIKKEKIKQLKKKSCTSLTEILKKELNSISDFELQEEKFECNISIPNYLNEKSGEIITVGISVVALLVATMSAIGSASSELSKTLVGIALPLLVCCLLLDFEFLRFVVKSSGNSERKMYYAFKLECINEVLAEREKASISTARRRHRHKVTPRKVHSDKKI